MRGLASGTYRGGNTEWNTIHFSWGGGEIERITTGIPASAMPTEMREH